MRKQILFSIYILSVMLLSSCLGEGGNKVEMQLQPAVLDLNPDSRYGVDRLMHIYGNNSIYTSALSNISGEDGDCYLVEFTLDYSLADNADSAAINGYYTVENLSTITVPTKNAVASTDLPTNNPEAGADTIKALDNEVIIKGIQGRSTYLKDHYFLFANHASTDSIIKYPIDFNLTYAPNQTGVYSETYGGRVYELYLRAFRKAAGSSADNLISNNYDQLTVDAFDIGTFVDIIADREFREGSDTLRFVVKYAGSFNNDSSKISKWNDSPVVTLVTVSN